MTAPPRFTATVTSVMVYSRPIPLYKKLNIVLGRGILMGCFNSLVYTGMFTVLPSSEKKNIPIVVIGEKPKALKTEVTTMDKTKSTMRRKMKNIIARGSMTCFEGLIVILDERRVDIL